MSDNDGALRVRYSGGDATFVLGKQSEKWAERIRSPKSLIDKLDVKAESHGLRCRDSTMTHSLNALRERAARVIVGRLAPSLEHHLRGCRDDRWRSRDCRKRRSRDDARRRDLGRASRRVRRVDCEI